MGWSEWKKVLELAVGNPELIGAFFLVLLFLGGIVGLTAAGTWFIRGAISAGRIGALEERLRLKDDLLSRAGDQLRDTNERLTLATTEQAKLQEQIQTRAAMEKLAATAASSLGHLQNATTSATAAFSIIRLLPDHHDR